MKKLNKTEGMIAEFNKYMQDIYDKGIPVIKDMEHLKSLNEYDDKDSTIRIYGKYGSVHIELADDNEIWNMEYTFYPEAEFFIAQDDYETYLNELEEGQNE